MENKADYAELRRLYFSPREIDRTPSHSKVSNDEMVIEQSTNSFSSDLHNFLTNQESLTDEEQIKINASLGDGPKSAISQRSSELINNLCDRYGNRTYQKITSMIHKEDFEEWEQLEKELFASELSLNMNEVEESSTGLIYDEIVNDLDELTSIPIDDDLDYLDALVSYDYSRLLRFQSGQECISSIFSEILENEQHSNMNYQDDVFNKNIELIFNSDIDLDSSDWCDESEQKTIINRNLEETIEQLKQQCQSTDCLEDIKKSDFKQAELEAFYSETICDLKEEMATLSSHEEIKQELNQITQKSSMSGLKLYIGMTIFILIILVVFLIF